MNHYFQRFTREFGKQHSPAKQTGKDFGLLSALGNFLGVISELVINFIDYDKNNDKNIYIAP